MIKRRTKFFGALGLFAALTAAIFQPEFSLGQNINQPANPDTMFCATRGSIATRLANRWQCLTPGTSGQVLKTNGPGADAGWLTVTGTGTVSSVAATVPAFMTVTGSPITTAGTLAITANSQTANQVLAAPNGAAGVPGFRSLVAADIPAISLTSGISGILPVANGGTNSATASGTALDNITGFAGTGIMRRTGAGAYTQGTTVAVNEGGTGTTSAGGTALDNISGFSTTGVVQRTGAATYSTATIPAILGSQTANQIFAAPNGSAGNPGFRAMVSADVPTNLALTGVPTAPTATNGTNTTQLATTAFVQNAIGTLPGGPTFVAKTSDVAYSTSTLTADANLVVTMAASTRYFIHVEGTGNTNATSGGYQLGFILSNAVNSTHATCSGPTSTASPFYVGSGGIGPTGAGTYTIYSASGAGTGGATFQFSCSIMVDNITANATMTMAFANGSANTFTVYHGAFLYYGTF